MLFPDCRSPTWPGRSPFTPASSGSRSACSGRTIRPTFALLDRDAVSLGFFTPDAHRGRVTIGTADLYLGADDVMGLHAAIKDVVPVEWGPEVYFYGRREFAVRDPDGYLLIFTEPTDDPPTGPE